MAAGAETGLLVHEPIAESAAGCEGPVEIRDAVADMMNAGPSPGQEPGDGALVGSGLEQFDLDAAKAERDDGCAIGFLGRARLDSQYVAIEGKCALDAFDRDADVGDSRLISHWWAVGSDGFKGAPKK